MNNKDNIVSVRDLHVSFRSPKNRKKIIEIIRGVSFDVPKAKIVGFIGESGSGKSVTAKSLLGINLNNITSADEVLVGGISLLDEKNGVKSLTKKRKVWSQVRGKKITYIPQDPMTSLNPTTTIGAQIIESLILHYVPTQKVKPTKQELQDKAIALLEKFGVTNAKERFNSYPHEFSGGMRQRVIIAMAVACGSEVIIADEPTTALDPTVQASVLELFQNIVKEYGTSIIFVSHDIAVIATLCDYINVFYAGRIVERGTKKDIFTDPRHPYTWLLLSAMPDSNKGGDLFTIPGQPPQFDNLPAGDPFSVRNPFAMEVDFRKEPPLFKVSETHEAATWLLHPSSPKVEMPKQVKEIIDLVKKDIENVKK